MLKGTGTLTTRSSASFEERIGRLLIEAEILTGEQLEGARRLCKQRQAALLDVLLAERLVTRDTLITVLALQLKIPVVDLKTVHVDPEAVKLAPEDLARKHRVLPIGFESDGSLRTVTLTPNDFQAASQLAAVTGHQPRFVLAIGGSLDELIERTYASLPASSPAGSTSTRRRKAANAADAPDGPNGRTPDQQTPPLLGQDLTHLPAIQAVETITLQGIKRKASDIHLVPTSDAGSVLYRLDGVLQQVATTPMRLHESMIARIKVLADMDISEVRRPQDGSFTLNFGEKRVDFRVSTVGITWGEMMVVRILDRSGGIMRLEELGMEDVSIATWRQLLTLPFGMLLVSGPTGSGKTTTLYSSVTELVKDRGNIMTIEDPIEYRVEDLHQIEVNRQAGVDFPTGLKSIMRLDPDVILVGEIRDAETAKTAVDAALTGHLVLASIHSNDAASAFVRLLDIGIEPYLAATAIAGTVAQRLVRKVCPHCRAVSSDISGQEAFAYETEMGVKAKGLLAGTGCNFCGFTGFLGRTGVFEVLPVSDSIRKLVATGASGQDIRAQALLDGMTPLRRSGMVKVQAGITTVNEVLRRVFFFE